MKVTSEEIFDQEREHFEAQTTDAEIAGENLRGRLLMRNGYTASPQGDPESESFRSALEHFKKAHSLDPENPHHSLNMADALFALGRSEEAVIHFNTAAPRLDPDSKHLEGVTRRWIHR